MATLVELRQRLEPLQKRDRIYEIALRTAKRFEAYLIDLNQIQLSKGQNIFGELIGVYSQATEDRAKTEDTRRPKIAGQNYNFEWTGELFDGMKVRLTSDFLEIFSTADHTDLVVAKFSNIFGEEALFGLTPESLSEFVERITPDIQKEVCEALNLRS